VTRTAGAGAVDRPATRGGRWSRLVDRLAPSPVVYEADELRTASETLGCSTIATAPIAVPVRVAGTIRSLTLRSRAQVPALEVDLYDGSETLVLVFLGRRAIRGITPGRRLVARGRVTRRGSSLVMYNPTYELLPAA
jgi:RecG-like helicase